MRPPPINKALQIAAGLNRAKRARELAFAAIELLPRRRVHCAGRNEVARRGHRGNPVLPPLDARVYARVCDCVFHCKQTGKRRRGGRVHGALQRAAINAIPVRAGWAGPHGQSHLARVGTAPARLCHAQRILERRAFAHRTAQRQFDIAPEGVRPMTLNFDPGYIREPFATLCDRAPDASIYPYSSRLSHGVGADLSPGPTRWLGARPLHRTGSGRA